MKTLAMVKWERESAGWWTGSAESVDGLMVYNLVVKRDDGTDGWIALLVVNGEAVHTSEHSSRDDAKREAGAALKRAIDLRES